MHAMNALTISLAGGEAPPMLNVVNWNLSNFWTAAQRSLNSS